MPYLPAVGAPALRFRAETPPPDLVARPVAAAAPPLPALSRTESSVALANAAAAQSASTPAATDSHPGETNGNPPVKLAPLPILPDETRPQVRPEDFLPFFQIPGSATQPGGVIPLGPTVRSAPAPAPLPPSSATYSQTP